MFLIETYTFICVCSSSSADTSNISPIFWLWTPAKRAGEPEGSGSETIDVLNYFLILSLTHSYPRYVRLVTPAVWSRLAMSSVLYLPFSFDLFHLLPWTVNLLESILESRDLQHMYIEGIFQREKAGSTILNHALIKNYLCFAFNLKLINLIHCSNRLGNSKVDK